ncbi:hypothetical protein [Chitinophaga pinensis]|uniref:Uncharacterized protein n=1 Tax=Chitinophaga pinensis (strain ATCC 43595 / DSM 2588 / LMG 13176 / NBRC 15968 / NCIMB 11800 / UQM 2034) TaxID=485918 RepID=A0A979FYW1_CHIPD|nr:hypothetical protein [Chitinophaga pinensis]ACU57656.1 hypothetical protein Cpin_0154 [Chitinophaga pinensis DSM 2588]
MIDRQFCDMLAYRLCDAFKYAGDNNLSAFWCDGILLPENVSVSGKRTVVMKAFIDKSGQTAYRMTLKLGNKALSRYTRGLRIEECIPDEGFDSWVWVDTINEEIEVQLN